MYENYTWKEIYRHISGNNVVCSKVGPTEKTWKFNISTLEQHNKYRIKIIFGRSCKDGKLENTIQGYSNVIEVK